SLHEKIRTYLCSIHTLSIKSTGSTWMRWI
ncbi:hypothetical protein, partial [Bacillus phage SPG24]